jgi:hypothetical protein
MIAERLVELIEINAARLSADVAADLARNERTRGFSGVRRAEMEERIFQIVHHLGDWIGDRRSEKVKIEFADWGRRRFGQGIPVSEIVYAILVLKQHLRRYIREHGLVEASFPRVEQDYVLPMHLNSLQELNTQVGLFFDEALYHLARGYEEESRTVEPRPVAAR